MAADERWFTVAAEMLVTVPGEDRPIGRLRPGQSYQALSFDDDWVWVPGPDGAVGVVSRRGVTFTGDDSSDRTDTGPSSEVTTPGAESAAEALPLSSGPAAGARAVGVVLLLGGALIVAGSLLPWHVWDYYEWGVFYGGVGLTLGAGIVVVLIGGAVAAGRAWSVVPVTWLPVGAVAVLVIRFAWREHWYVPDFTLWYWMVVGGGALVVLGNLMWKKRSS